MSINLVDPPTVRGKIDAAANLVEQMWLAHSINDEKHFKKCHQNAGKLLFDAMRQLDRLQDKSSIADDGDL
jgi:hypothetical protein